ncbi:hypothetical protein NN3_18350 [Nocardia neocaledoniensis NBRC 108232]|nr:hypothetical protein [Nocardia neocaledoniensis]GEM30828.1 hypothetical protein NN3_18350 [Nocardia neocaledoniensis NBRC 108232]
MTVATVLGVVASIVSGTLVILVVIRRSERHATTTELIATFFSASFVAHRRELDRLWDQIDRGTVSPARLAFGCANLTVDSPTDGPTSDGRRNVHLAAYITYLIRLDHALGRNHVDVERTRSALAVHLVRHDAMVQLVAAAALRRPARNAAAAPAWVESTERVRDRLIARVR